MLSYNCEQLFLYGHVKVIWKHVDSKRREKQKAPKDKDRFIDTEYLFIISNDLPKLEFMNEYR